MTRTRLALALLAALAGAGPLTGCVLPAGALMGPLSPGRISTVQIDVDPAKTSVVAGETIRLGVRTNLGGANLSYAWSATGGQLSSDYGQTVSWTATGAGRAVVTCTVSSADSSGTAQVQFTTR